jgi:hypothetical protein
VAPLTQIIMLTFGPRAVIGEEFANLAADRIVILGFWAVGLSGEPGPPPADIDVMVVGDGVVRDEVYAAAERAEARLGRPINPVVRTNHAWQRGWGTVEDLLTEGALERVSGAARKACVALLAQQGLRTKSGGHHVTTERVVRAQFGGPFDAFASLRRKRMPSMTPRANYSRN